MIPPEVADHPDVTALTAYSAGTVTAAKFDRGEFTLWIDPARIVPVCEFLKADRQYRYLACITAVDWYPAEPRFEVVYHIYSHARHQRLRLKVKLGSENPEAASVTPVWRAANWFEREVFDLFGIRFAGHPNLTRILMPDDWQGHPLRKDYPVTGYR